MYSTLPYDKVVKDGKVIGVSTWCGYSANEGAMLTLAIVDVEHSEPGTPVTFVWGEEGGGSSKPTVERHVQLEIRATVAPVLRVTPTAYRVKKPYIYEYPKVFLKTIASRRRSPKTLDTPFSADGFWPRRSRAISCPSSY